MDLTRTGIFTTCDAFTQDFGILFIYSSLVPHNFLTPTLPSLLWQKRPFSSRVSPVHFSFVSPAIFKGLYSSKIFPLYPPACFYDVQFIYLYLLSNHFTDFFLLISKVFQLILFDRSGPYYLQMMINCFPF